MGIIKKTRAFIMTTYALYASIGGAWACYDSTTRKEFVQSHAPVRLLQQDFEVRRPHRQSIKLTVLGETHVYTPKESMIAARVLNGVDAVLIEGADENATPGLGDIVFELSVMVQQLVAYQCSAQGTGGSISYSTVEDLARERSLPLIPLENGADGFVQGLDFKTKALFWGSVTKNAILCPETYRRTRNKTQDFIEGKKDWLISVLADRSDMPGYEQLIVKRDRLMAQAATEYISHTENATVLLITGSAHTPGIIAHLCESLDLRPLSELRQASLDEVVERNLSQ